MSDAGKLIDQSNDDDITPRMTSSEGKVHSLKKRPGSGKTRRTVPPTEVDSQSIDSNFSLTEDISCINETDKTTDINSRNLKANRLPPISQSKSKLKRIELPTLELRNKLSTNQKSKNFKTTLQNNENTDKDTLHSSPETRIKNRRNLNESGIDSEGDDTETTGYEVGIGYHEVAPNINKFKRTFFSKKFEKYECAFGLEPECTLRNPYSYAYKLKHVYLSCLFKI